MIAIKCVSREEYDKYLQDKAVSYLQKSYWGELKSYFGEYRPQYFLINQDEQVIGGFLALERSIGKGLFRFKLYYIPRTTIFFDVKRIKDSSLLKEVFTQVKEKLSISLIDLEYPYWTDVWKDNSDWLSLNTNIYNSGLALDHWIQPHHTLIKKTFEDDLLASIPSSNARRNCKRGEKKLNELGVRFEVKDKLESDELEQAYKLITEVSSAKKFNKRSLEYFRKLQEIPESIWFLFKDKNSEIILANYGIINKDTSSYTDLYVGRDLNYDKLYISYVLKLSSFEYLKKKKVQFYDHWGVDLDPKSEMYQFSLFKQHFGGEIIDYLPLLILAKGWRHSIAKAGIFLIKLLQKTKK